MTNDLHHNRWRLRVQVNQTKLSIQGIFFHVLITDEKRGNENLNDTPCNITRRSRLTFKSGEKNGKIAQCGIFPPVYLQSGVMN